MKTDVRLALDLLRLAQSYDAGADWEKAMAEAADHISKVLVNNVGTPLWKVMARPDVKQASTEPFLDAAQRTIAQVTSAWGHDPQSPELARIVKTVNANAKGARAAIRKATSKDPSQTAANLEALGKQLATRAEYAVQNAKAKSETLAMLDGHEGGKTWVGHDPECAACIALDGTTIPAGEEFDPKAGGLKLGTYGPLLGPPRHPNCRCTLELS